MTGVCNPKTKRITRVSVLIWLAGVANSAAAQADTETEVVQNIVAEVAPSVVRIQIIGDVGGEQLSISSATITGVAISDTGDIITSSFGFSGRPSAIFVTDPTGRRIAAKIVATDHVRKLVLLRCEAGQFRTVEPGDNRWPQPGTAAIALGRFYSGETPSVSVGIVSAVKRIYGLAIQTDAKISPVNYGGPLVNLRGQCMGILVPLSPQDADGIAAGVEWYDSGIGFCIPYADVIETAERLKAGGDLHRGRMGVAFSTRNPLAVDVTVSRVHPGSPADSAGLKTDDVIVEANGKPIGRYGHFEAIVKQSYAGQTLKLKVRRGTENVSTEIVLTDKLKPVEQGYLGIVPMETAKDSDTESAGARVYVLPTGPCADAGLADKVTITEWSGEAIDSVGALLKHITAVRPDEEIAIGYRSSEDGSTQTATITPTSKPADMDTLPEQIVRAIAGIEPDVEWQRTEESLGENRGKVWFYAPKVDPTVESGLIVLLSVQNQPPESVINHWKEWCQLHNLILVVPIPPEAADLSREHFRHVRRAMRVVVQGRSIDTQRVVMITEAPQAELCSELLFHPRVIDISGGVFTKCLPRISGLSSAQLSRRRVSVMMIADHVQSRQSVALQNSLQKSLADAGVNTRLNEIDSADESPVEQDITSWIATLKVR